MSGAPDATDTLGLGSWRPHHLRWAVLVLTDLLALSAAATLAVSVRYAWDPALINPHTYLRAWPCLGLFPLLIAMRRLYASLPGTAHEQLRHITLSLTLGFAILGAATFLTGQAVVWSRAVLLFAWACALILVPLSRWMITVAFCHRSWWQIPCLILGGGATGMLVTERLRKHPWIGLRPVAILDDNPDLTGSTVGGVPVLGPLASASRLAQTNGLDTAILAMPGASAERLHALERDNSGVFPRLILVPALVGFASTDIHAHDLGGVVGIVAKRQLLLPLPRLAKRLLDLALLAILAIPVCLLTALITVALKLTSRGSVFFVQTRLGIDGRPFKVLKFRTMVVDAEARLEAVLAADPNKRTEYDRFHKLRDDPRITHVGQLLRRTSLDELPQYFNVLRGEMSFVGPRAYLASERSAMGDADEIILKVRPGISGLWQVSGRNQLSFAERLVLETHYIRIWSVWLDIVILARTALTLLGKGAY